MNYNKHIQELDTYHMTLLESARGSVLGSPHLKMKTFSKACFFVQKPLNLK